MNSRIVFAENTQQFMKLVQAADHGFQLVLPSAKLIQYDLCESHMGYFRLIYQLEDVNIRIEFECDRGIFTFILFDNEGGTTSMPNIIPKPNFSRAASASNFQRAIEGLAKAVHADTLEFYVRKNGAQYSKKTGKKVEFNRHPAYGIEYK